MTFNAPSFFAGVGTVVVLLAFGFGGGVLVSGILSDNGPRAPNKVERRAAASEAAPPTITTKPGPVTPAPAGLPASTPNPDRSPKPSESANAPVAQPQSPAPAQQQVQPVTPAAHTATPELGPQQPVALVNPDQAQDRGEVITQQAKRLSDTQPADTQPASTRQAKRLIDERKNAERRRAERLRQRETRQIQRQAPAGSSSEDEADSDVRGERRLFILRERPERPEFGPPSLFRFFDQ